MGSAAVTPYPWQTLEGVTRATARAGHALRRHVDTVIEMARLEGTISGVLRQEASVRVHAVRLSNAPPVGHVAVEIRVDGAPTRLVCVLERQLAAVVLATLLGRPERLDLRLEPLPPELDGALSAVVLEILRRAAPDRARWIAVEAPQGSTPAGEAGLEVQAAVLLGGRPYSVALWVSPAWCPIPGGSPRLGDLGDLPLKIPLVGGLATGSREELGSLETGDVWCCGEGWWLDRQGSGAAVLAAPASETGVRVDFDAERGMVVSDRVVPVPWSDDGVMVDTQQVLADVALDAPLVVRVEVGAVCLTAREWAALRPGDVIETSRRLGEPVLLRIGGNEAARGELVNVEGELGVRILELVAGG